MPRFIHAADIHLDSPLQRLESYEGAPVEEIRGATRRALENLVDLAIREEVDFVVIAGDLYDGDWRDHNTGLFFVRQATKLISHGIPLYVIRGNHDAASILTQSLPLPQNPDGSPILLSSKRPETVRLESLGVSIHGLSFRNRAETDNLALQYPEPDAGMFNLGLLHTSLTGGEGHEPYAPCTPQHLADKGYDYWALGHIHLRGERHLEGTAPVVFAGNVQGRHTRETGPKGCVLVDIGGNRQTTRTFVPLDVVRWEICPIDLGEHDHVDEIVDRFGNFLSERLEHCDDRSLVVRARVSGRSELHTTLIGQHTHYENALRARALDIGGGRVWVESLRIRSELPAARDPDIDWDGPIASLLLVLDELGGDGEADETLGKAFAELSRKVPAEIFEADIAELVAEARPSLLARLRGIGDSSSP
ncbi:metallophosphoesterase family protein [Candidatus Laterigemmans baculatus]|uniref:metallophosphoesterase family protein n=1 Tax=Candidatus Laterigemmans baculatus TaxID=2770505 RepID=UPI0013D9A8F9|nr:DNA repair exonuclease [Candidatus Laterigemmans baculatus]